MDISGYDIECRENHQPDQVGGMPVTGKSHQSIMIFSAVTTEVCLRQNPDKPENPPAHVDQMIEGQIIIGHLKGISIAGQALSYIPADFHKLD